ncbi:MAG: ATP-binding protein, partial [Anaerolineae bacterium]
AEAALHESEEKFRILTESSPVGIFLDDAEGNAIYVNDRCAELVGLPPEECLKFNWVPSIHPDDRERVTGEWAKAVERGELFQLEYRWVHANGRIVWTLGKVAPVKNQSGQVICYVGTLVDITERKRIAAEKEELAAQFYQSQKMDSIGQLAGGVAHDFNNLLVPIMGYADLGMLKLSPDNVHYTQFKRIKAAAERAAGLTRQILAFSRRQILKMNILNLNDVAASFREMLHRLIGEDISLQMHLAADLQPIEADKAQLEQVLLNLAVNARDAMPNGGKLTIETANALLDEAYVARHAGSQPGPHVMLAVSDTGSGMDAETRRRIFEPFFTTKKRGRGTGLGLSTVFGIVKQHGGNIWVYSEPNRGTTFKLYFPITKAAAPTGEAAPPESGSLRGAETVLVVEDESSVRKLVVETLRSNGYHILEAGGPVEGLEAAAASPDTIHLLLTDVIMPDMSGQELYLQLVRVRPDLKVLYMSGYTDNVIAHHGVLQEGVTLLQKPFTIRSLLQTIRSVLR